MSSRLKIITSLYIQRKRYLFDFVTLPLIIGIATFTSNPEAALIKYVLTYIPILLVSLLLFLWMNRKD